MFLHRLTRLAPLPLAARLPHVSQVRHIHCSPRLLDRSFTNLLADAAPPPVQVSSISASGIRLVDGLLLSGPCVFLEGKVFLWDVPTSVDRWTKEHFELFDVVVPRPEILLLGTGKTIVHPLPALRTYLNALGIQLDVMDTRNACSTYNLLAEEGRRVAAALLPYTATTWQKAVIPFH